MHKLVFILSWVLSIGATSGTPTPPSQDPFYRVPAGYEKEAPGSILSNRSLPYVLQQPIPEFLEEGYQVLYRTSDSFGEPTAAVATLLIPPGADSSKVFVYQAVMDAACADCSPSYTLADGVKADAYDGAITIVHCLTISAALNQGWIVVVPDHEGLKASFMANRLGAYVVLDSIRAALLSRDFTNISPDAATVLMGYSGAALPTTLAVELQESYAPEVKITGAVLGGLIPQIQLLTENWNASSWTGSLSIALWGLASEYPVVSSLIEQNLVQNQEKREQFKSYQNQCFGSVEHESETTTIANYFDRVDFLNSTAVQQILAENSLGQETPKIPLLIYQSSQDNTSPIEVTDKLVSQYCTAGVSVDYRKYTTESHLSLGIDGSFPAMIWVKDRFDGLPLEKGCFNSTGMMALTDPEMLEFLPESVEAGLERLLNEAGNLAFGQAL